MAQTDFVYVIYPKYLRSVNLSVPVYMAYNSIVLDNISIDGVSNMALEINNANLAGNVTDAAIYGSPDGVNYFLLHDNIFAGNVGPSTFSHKEFTGTTGFIRVVISSDTDMNIDVYFHGNTA
jgi:hypothetical protein